MRIPTNQLPRTRPCRNCPFFYNRILGGRERTSILRLWTTGGAAMLPKYDDEASHTGWRPISIGDCLYRHFGKTTLSKLQGDMTSHRLHLTRPLQMGIMSPSGCEIGARQVCYDVDTSVSLGIDKIAIIKVDIANAFPTIPRRTIYDALQVHAPRLCRVFRMLYDHPSRLYTSRVS